MQRFRHLARYALGLVLLCQPPWAIAQSALPRLNDGAPFRVHGKLRLVYKGWHRYLVLDLGRVYVANFGREVGTRRVSAIELSSEGNFGTLAKHAGEVIEADGKLQLEGVSPYYWNGTMLMADRVTLPDGTVFHSITREATVPSETKLYLATVTMIPHQFAWRREAIDLETRRPLPDPDVDGCGLNGGGDVMNCFCAAGFAPARAGMVVHPLPPDRWEEVPASQLTDPRMAQFGMADPDARRPQTFQVVCRRNGSGPR